MDKGNGIFEGFVTVAAIAPEVKLGDCEQNGVRLAEAVSAAEAAGAKLICSPELSITGYTGGDLFLQDALLDDALAALRKLMEATKGSDALVFVGLPVRHMGKVYNAAAAFSGGKLLGFVPKTWLSNHGGASESRYFTSAPSDVEEYIFDGKPVHFGADLLFQCSEFQDFTVAVEIGEDLWATLPPSTRHARSGATVVVNLSATGEVIGAGDDRRLYIQSQSRRAVCAYIYADAAYGESTGDMVFSGHSLVYENGKALAERAPFESGFAIADIDVASLARDRRYLSTFSRIAKQTHRTEMFSQPQSCGLKNRLIDPHPFVPDDGKECAARCEEILQIQSSGLMRRLDHVKASKAVIGVSGGLDSTIALLVTARAMHILGKSGDDILAVSMPGPGTSPSTRASAKQLSNTLGVNFREIEIGDSVRQHLQDISHPEEEHDTVFENAQARIRTLILMDIANKYGGIVVGTSDLSELALGWATYNGDQMSMYGVNSGVPKTLIRHILMHIAETEPALSGVLRAILDTPASPELLPPESGHISQKTEELLGSYELHDFFLYHSVRKGRTPALVYKLAVRAFADQYDEDRILTALQLFYRRFFANQFKRSALPDGPKTGSVSLSPRTDWHMPSDVASDAWLRTL